jgi:phytoene synthase
MPTQTLATIDKPGSTLYYSCLFLTAAQKQSLAPLLSFIWRTERIPRFSSEPEVVTTQLSWWQKELALAYNQQATHPLIIELTQSINNHADQIEPADFSQKSVNQLIASLSYLLNQQQDCQNDDAAAFLIHARKKRAEFINLASALIEATPLDQQTLSTASELLTRIDIVDGFHRDADAGIVNMPLDNLIKEKITVDDLTNKNVNNRKFWGHWLQQSLTLYKNLWQQQHPLVEVILIYSGLRLIAHKKSLQKTSSTSNNCYNSRATLSPLQKFWLSWRIHSRWSSRKTPLRNLTP